MAILLDEVAHVLSKHKLPTEQYKAIINDLNNVEEEKKEDKAANGPKTKNILVPIILDPEGILRGKELMGFVVQVKEGTPTNEILPRLFKAAYNQNVTSKRKRWVFKKLSDIVEHIKRKYTKEQEIAIKGKQLVQVVTTDGIVPTS